jgi:hypothetical protein
MLKEVAEFVHLNVIYHIENLTTTQCGLFIYDIDLFIGCDR